MTQCLLNLSYYVSVVALNSGIQGAQFGRVDFAKLWYTRQLNAKYYVVTIDSSQLFLFCVPTRVLAASVRIGGGIDSNDNVLRTFQVNRNERGPANTTCDF